MLNRVLAVLFCILTAQGCAEVSTKVSGPIERGTPANSSASTDATEGSSDIASLVTHETFKVPALEISIRANETEAFSSDALIEEANRFDVHVFSDIP